MGKEVRKKVGNELAKKSRKEAGKKLGNEVEKSRGENELQMEVGNELGK